MAYDKWVAQYAEKCTYWQLWDVAASWRRAGLCRACGRHSVPVVNACYRDYPEIIKGKPAQWLDARGWPDTRKQDDPNSRV
ncbi:MAG: hypothetical protein ACLVJ8_17800 [Ruthenibacterium lactatiformans]